MLGAGFGEAVMWGLLWDDPPLGVRQEIKMVFRLTGTGPFDIVAIHEDGLEIEPNWGPNKHGADGSSYGRPGDEWGMAFFFTETGCWNLHVTRGLDTVDMLGPGYSRRLRQRYSRPDHPPPGTLSSTHHRPGTGTRR